MRGQCKGLCDFYGFACGLAVLFRSLQMLLLFTFIWSYCDSEQFMVCPASPAMKWWSLDGPGPNQPQNVDVTVLECSCLIQQRTVSNRKKRRNTVLAVTARQIRGANLVGCKSGWNTGMKCLCVCKECHRIHRDRVPLGAMFHMSLSPYRNAVRKCTCRYLQPQNSVT